jgi:hypothetical protein
VAPFNTDPYADHWFEKHLAEDGTLMRREG